MSREMDELVFRWMRALWELTDETGVPQRMSAVSKRAGMTSDEGIVACVFAHMREMTIKLECPGPGYRNEWVPRGER